VIVHFTCCPACRCACSACRCACFRPASVRWAPPGSFPPQP